MINTDTWEQRKLSEVAEIVGGGTPSTNIPEYWDGDIDWYAPAEINDQIYVDGSERKITKLGLEKSSAKILPADITVLFTSRAGIGKTAILRRSGATNQGFQSMVLNDETNPYFVFSISKFIKEEAERVASGSTFAEVSGKMLGNLAFMFPTKKEQDKIGEYFSNLDNLITLHQRKLFLNFAKRNDWEQRKLGEILIGLQNNTLSRADLSNETGVAKNVHYGDVLIKFGEVLDVSKEKLPMISDESVLSKYKSSFLQNGDVIVADTAEDSTVGKCSEIAGLNDEIVLSGLHTIPYRPIEKFASGYLGYYLNSSAYHNQLIPLMQGIKVTSISKSAMQDTDIVYPKSMEEQGKIGDYFQSLDNLITLHRRAYYNKKGGLTNVHNDNQQHYAIL